MTSPEVHRQHRDLGEELRALEQLLEAAEETEYDVWLRELHAWFDGFVPTLEAHFHSEERSNMFAAVVEQEQHFVPKIVRLRSEHAEILTELFRIQREVLPTAAEPLLDELWAVAHRIRLHDTEESEILAHAYMEDAGVSDG